MDYLIALIVWIVCGIASLLIAQSRNTTNPVTWFFVGVLLGPLGVLIAAFGAKGPAQATGSTIGAADELAKLAVLRDAGTISTAEFERQKAGLLAGQAAEAQPPNRINQVVYATIVIVLVGGAIYMIASMQ